VTIQEEYVKLQPKVPVVKTTPHCFRLTFTFVDQERSELRDRRLGPTENE